MEVVLPPGSGELLGTLLDLNMLVSTGGRKRTTAEFRQLLGVVGFRRTRIVPTASPLSLIEAALV